MSKEYYELEVLIRGVVRVPVDEYSGLGHAIESVEMSSIDDVARNIEENNDKEYYITAFRHSSKKVRIE